MKKFVLLLCLLFSVGLAFAGGFSFQLFGNEPLYKESVFDPYGFTGRFILTITPDYHDRNFDLRAIVKDDVRGPETYYKDYSYYNVEEERKDYLYANLKVGTAFPLASFAYSGFGFPIDGEVAFGAYINSVFCLFQHSLNLGYDGSYFVGLSLRFDEKYTIRGGMHHLSGHYGDEMIKKFNEQYIVGCSGNSNYNYLKLSDYNRRSTDYVYANGFAEYVRDNTWNVAVSAELPAGFRVYSSIDFPMNPTILRPFVHNPGGLRSKIEDKPLSIRTATDEDIDSEYAQEYENTMKNSNYKALIAQFGVEWTKKLSFADLVLGANVYAHQDGQTLHKVDGYSKDNPWDFEYTAGVSLDLNDSIGSSDVCFVAQWHYGRPPLLNYFYKNPTNYIYIGAVLR